MHFIVRRYVHDQRPIMSRPTAAIRGDAHEGDVREEGLEFPRVRYVIWVYQNKPGTIASHDNTERRIYRAPALLTLETRAHREMSFWGATR